MLEQYLELVSSHLLGAMGLFVFCALTFRYLTYRDSRRDDLYYSTFSREVEKKIQDDSAANVLIENPSSYLENLLDHVHKKLPKRSIRSNRKVASKTKVGNTKKGSVSLRDYVGGQDALIHGLQEENKVFLSKYPPNYSSLTSRLMNQDDNWRKLYRVIPVDTLSRMIDVLPGVLVVMGVFGTFIGISMALPEVTRIDFANVDGSSEVLSEFVLKVTYAMDTSIVGILGSLILTFVNTLFPIRQNRAEIQRKVADSVEHLWLFLQDGRDEHQMAIYLPKMTKCLESIENKIVPQSTSETEEEEDILKGVA